MTESDAYRSIVHPLTIRTPFVRDLLYQVSLPLIGSRFVLIKMKPLLVNYQNPE